MAFGESDTADDAQTRATPVHANKVRCRVAGAHRCAGCPHAVRAGSAWAKFLRNANAGIDWRCRGARVTLYPLRSRQARRRRTTPTPRLRLIHPDTTLGQGPRPSVCVATVPAPPAAGYRVTAPTPCRQVPARAWRGECRDEHGANKA